MASLVILVIPLFLLFGWLIVLLPFLVMIFAPIGALIYFCLRGTAALFAFSNKSIELFVSEYFSEPADRPIRNVILERFHKAIATGAGRSHWPEDWNRGLKLRCLICAHRRQLSLCAQPARRNR